MWAMLAGELADRQFHAREDTAARQIGIRQLVLLDLAALPVQDPQDVVAFVGAV